MRWLCSNLVSFLEHVSFLVAHVLSGGGARRLHAEQRPATLPRLLGALRRHRSGRGRFFLLANRPQLRRQLSVDKVLCLPFVDEVETTCLAGCVVYGSVGIWVPAPEGRRLLKHRVAVRSPAADVCCGGSPAPAL